MSSILTNNSAMVALQTLKGINKNMGMIQNEISTGKTVATAKDNAAVWAISKTMESDVKGFSGISDSLALGSSTISVARQASETVTDLLTEIKGKIVAAQEGNVDREKIQTDIVALRDQITSVTGAAQFNGLNLVTGTDQVSILSSLDRASNGNVSASNIKVDRQDLTTTKGTVGTGASLASKAVIQNSATAVASAANTAAITYTATAANDRAVLNIGGTEVSFTVLTGAATVTDMAAGLAGAINGLGMEGVTATNTAGVLTISSTKAFEGLAVTQGITGTGTAAITSVNGAAPAAPNTATTSTISQRAEEIKFATGGANAGDGFTATIQGRAFSYVAGKGETMEDVARGLKIAIDSGGVTGVSTKVTQDATTGAFSLMIDNDGSYLTSMTLANSGAAGGKASGGLFGLDAINVTTTAGATASLSNVETMISKSIDAAAAFGSSQSRIEIQADFISNLSDALKSGIGSMVDADMEEASARLQALQVQQQLGVQALSIANQSPQSILSLFR